MTTASTIASLLGAPMPATVEAVAARVEALERQHGLRPPRPDDDGQAPEAFLRWLLRMALATVRRRQQPADVDPLLDAVTERLATRPAALSEHGQLGLDAASCLRRARAVDARCPNGAIALVGDDDGVSLALALLGRRELHVLDIDPRVLAWVRDAGDGTVTTHERDFFREPLPESLRRHAVAAVTDPFRSLDDGLPFVLQARACLRRGPEARLFLADHPDWNFEHGELVAAAGEAGLALRETLEDLHAYPLAPAQFADRAATASAFGLDPAWLDELISATEGSSHLCCFGWADEAARDRQPAGRDRF